MPRNCLKVWLAAAVAGLCLPGCKSTPAPHPYPNDPLLISKRPVEATAETARPTAVVKREPRVPPMPSEAVVSRSVSSDPVGRSLDPE